MKTLTKEQRSAKTKTYIVGFVSSILLTLAAFYFVQQGIDSDFATLSRRTIIFLIAGLALLQVLVQLIFFLHLDKERGPRLNLIMFASMVLTVLILVVGSLWIMDNLNYNMNHNMNETEQHEYMHENQGF